MPLVRLLLIGLLLFLAQTIPLAAASDDSVAGGRADGSEVVGNKRCARRRGCHPPGRGPALGAGPLSLPLIPSADRHGAVRPGLAVTRFFRSSELVESGVCLSPIRDGFDSGCSSRHIGEATF